MYLFIDFWLWGFAVISGFALLVGKQESVLSEPRLNAQVLSTCFILFYTPTAAVCSSLTIYKYESRGGGKEKALSLRKLRVERKHFPHFTSPHLHNTFTSAC